MKRALKVTMTLVVAALSLWTCNGPTNPTTTTTTTTTTTLPRGPTANAGGPYQIEGFRAVTFSGTQSTPGTNPITTYSWNPGDPSDPDARLSGPTPTYTYACPPSDVSFTATVTLTVTDSANMSSTAQTTCRVTCTY